MKTCICPSCLRRKYSRLRSRSQVLDFCSAEHHVSGDQTCLNCPCLSPCLYDIHQDQDSNLPPSWYPCERTFVSLHYPSQIACILFTYIGQKVKFLANKIKQLTSEFEAISILNKFIGKNCFSSSTSRQNIRIYIVLLFEFK